MIRLRSFFRAVFKNTVLGWKTDKSKRLTKDEAEEKLKEIILKLREKCVIEEGLEKLLKRCEKYENMLFTCLKYEGIPPDNTKRSGKSADCRPAKAFRRVQEPRCHVALRHLSVIIHDVQDKRK